MTKKNKRHGCTDGKFLVPIQKALKKGELSGEELFEKAKLLSPEGASLDNPKKSFIQALHCLLEDGIIRIEKYDLELDPRVTQSAFRFEYFVYGLVKRNFRYIRLLLLKLNEGDENAYTELKELFNRKIKEIELYNEKNWENLLEKVIIRKPTNKELAYYIALKEVKKEEMDLDPIIKSRYTKDEYNTILTDRYDDTLIKIESKICEYENDPQILDSYRNITLFLLEGSKNPAPPEEIDAPIPPSLDKMFVFNENKKNALEEMGFKKPIHRSDKQINDLFEDVIIHLNDEYINSFARALSDRENSKHLLNKITYESSHEKLIVEYTRYH